MVSLWTTEVLAYINVNSKMQFKANFRLLKKVPGSQMAANSQQCDLLHLFVPFFCGVCQGLVHQRPAGVPDQSHGNQRFKNVLKIYGFVAVFLGVVRYCRLIHFRRIGNGFSGVSRVVFAEKITAPNTTLAQQKSLNWNFI